MIKKYFSSIVLIFLIVSLSVLIKANYFKLKSIYVKNNYLWLTKNTIEKNGKPTAVILNTIKGKGIAKFENDPVWHARKVKEEDQIHKPFYLYY